MMWYSIRIGRLAWVGKRKWDDRMWSGVTCETGDWKRLLWRLFFMTWKKPKGWQ